MLNINKTIKENCNQLIDVVKAIFPQTKVELLLFLFFLLFYLFYSIILALNTSIIDHPYIITDLYFSFDNTTYFHSGYTYIAGHPFIDVLTKPFILIGDGAIALWGFKFKTILATISCSVMIALSIVYVYRYIKEVVQLKGYSLILLPTLYGFFTTNLILCFTTESFTISAFLLTLMTYYYSSCITKEKEVTFMTNFLFAFGLGGVTITNFAKGIIPVLFTKEKLLLKGLKICLIGFLFCAFLYYMNYKYQIFMSIRYSVSTYTNINTDNDLIQIIVSFFFGTPILASNIAWTQLIWDKSMMMIDFTTYTQWWQYLFIIVLALLCIYSIIRNYRNKLIYILALLIGFDIALHIFYNYGLTEGFIYGAHWIYVVPLFLAWLCKSFDEKYAKILIGFISFLSIVLVINNMVQMIAFINMAIEKFPVVIP